MVVPLDRPPLRARKSGGTSLFSTVPSTAVQWRIRTVPKESPAVRILPMSSNEKSFRGRSVEDVQKEFFLKELPSPSRSGRYRYPTSGLSAEPGAVVLFQYEGRIIASAIFDRNERFEQPEDGYIGALWFDVNKNFSARWSGRSRRDLARIQKLRPRKAIPGSDELFRLREAIDRRRSAGRKKFVNQPPSFVLAARRQIKRRRTPHESTNARINPVPLWPDPV
jgi:hypothetical protein